MCYSKLGRIIKSLEVTDLQGIGEILKKTREELGISLEEVAEATKIRTKYLRALEEENFDALPGDVYAKGFATAYLKYLGIKDRPDVVEVMKPKVKEPEIPEVMEEPEPPRKLAVTPKRKNTSERFEETPLNKNAKLIIILSLAAILLLFVIQGVYSKEMASEHQPEQQMEQQVEENQEPEKTPEDPEEPAVPQEPEAPVYDGLEMRLEIINANPNAADQCWMQITVDGKLTETTMSEGQVQDIKAAQNIQLNLGNSGVVKVTLNGQDLGVLGNQGQVVKKSFNLEDYVTQTQ